MQSFQRIKHMYALFIQWRVFHQDNVCSQLQIGSCEGCIGKWVDICKFHLVGWFNEFVENRFFLGIGLSNRVESLIMYDRSECREALKVSARHLKTRRHSFGLHLQLVEELKTLDPQFLLLHVFALEVEHSPVSRELETKLSENAY